MGMHSKNAKDTIRFREIAFYDFFQIRHATSPPFIDIRLPKQSHADKNPDRRDEVFRL